MLRLKRGWNVPAIIWTAVVGESGSAKTPAFKLVMRALQDRQNAALAKHSDEMRQHAIDEDRFDAEKAEWKKNRRDRSAEPPVKPDPPHAERCMVKDTTVEALASILHHNPRGVLVCRDELAGWFGSFNKYSNGKGADSAHWLSMHTGETLIVDRKSGSERTIYVPQAYVSVCGGIQPGVLNQALGHEHRESGLAARLLMAFPPRIPRSWTEADIEPAAEASMAQLVDRLFELQPTSGENGGERAVVLGLSPEARSIWIEFYNAHNDEQIELESGLSAAYSKLEEYAARFGLVIQCVRSVSDGSVNTMTVDDISMAAGIELANWFKRETRRVYAILNEDASQRDQRKLIELIERKGGSITSREVRQCCRWINSSDESDQKLNELVKSGIGDWVDVPSTGKGGRPTRIFRLEGNSIVYETPEKHAKNQGSVDVDSVEDLLSTVVKTDSSGHSNGFPQPGVQI